MGNFCCPVFSVNTKLSQFVKVLQKSRNDSKGQRKNRLTRKQLGLLLVRKGHCWLHGPFQPDNSCGMDYYVNVVNVGLQALIFGIYSRTL